MRNLNRQMHLNEFELFLSEIGPEDIPEGTVIAPMATLCAPYYLLLLLDREAYDDGRKVIV